MNNEKEKYQQFCLDLTEKYLKELSGEGENSEYIINNRPSEKILIGILDSGIQNNESTRYTSMPMVKVQFFVNSDEKGEIKLNISGNLYYNVLPTYEEEIKFVNNAKDEIKKRKSLNDETEENNEEEIKFNRIEIVSKYKKVPVAEIWKDIIISKKELLQNGKIDFSNELNNRLYERVKFEDSVYFNEKEINEDAIQSKENFENFNQNIFSNEISTNFNISPKQNILNIKQKCIEFVNNFDNPNSKNLLFTGNTGLGKTYMSNCIANELIKKGKNVLYQTAPVLLETIIDNKFNKYKTANKDNFYKDVLEADLLIIDDLGTECLNSMKLSELFTILNTRILNLNNKVTKTIISTNLNINNIFKSYEERIGSRIVGYYDIYYFFGEDLRFKRK